MPDLTTLRESHGGLVNQIREARTRFDESDEAKSNGGNWTEAQIAELRKWTAEEATLREQIKAREDIDKIESEANAAADRAKEELERSQKEALQKNEERYAELAANARASMANGTGDDGSGKVQTNDLAEFAHWLLTRTDHKGMYHDSWALQFGAEKTTGDARFRNMRALTTSAASNGGGNAIVDEPGFRFYESLYENSTVREAGAEVIVTATGASFPLIGMYDLGTDNILPIVAEGAENDGDNDPDFSQVMMGALTARDDLTLSRAFVRDDATGLLTRIPRMVGIRYGRRENITATDELLRMFGVTAASNGVELIPATGATGTLSFDTIIDLMGKCGRAYRNATASRFMMNSDMQFRLLKLKDSNGDYIWIRNNIQGGIVQPLLNRGVVFNDDMPDPGTNAKVMTFGDHGVAVKIRVVQGVVVEPDTRNKSTSDQLEIPFHADYFVRGFDPGGTVASGRYSAGPNPPVSVLVTADATI